MNNITQAALLSSFLAVPSFAFAQTAVVTVPSEVESYVVKEKTPR